MTFGSLIVRHGHGAFATYALDRVTFSIGSATDNDLVLNDPAVAPHHLQIVSNERGSQVLDLGSPGGTTLDGERLDQRVHPLRGGSILKVGATTIVVNLAPTAAAQPPIASPAPPLREPTPVTGPTIVQPALALQPGKGDIGLRLSADALQVEAGKTMSTRVTVRNRSKIVDRVELAVEGVPSSWVRIEPPRHDLDTTGREANGESEVIFSPPRAPQSEARTYPVNIVATSRVDPEARSSAPLTLTILRYSAFGLSIDPQRRSATVEGGYEVRISNGGNALEQYRLSADDEEDAVGFRFSPATLRVPPGETRVARARARARRIKLVGRPVNHEFTLLVEPIGGGVEPQAVRGTLAQRPPFATWLVAALAGLLLLSCLGLTGWLLAIGPIRAYLASRDATATAITLQTAEASAAAAQTSLVATEVAGQRTASAQLTQVAQNRDATLTAVAQREADRLAIANNDAERFAIQTAAAEERQDAQGTAGVLQANVGTAQAAVAAQRQTAERNQINVERTLTAVAATDPSATPAVTVTETFVAIPFETRAAIRLTEAALGVIASSQALTNTFIVETRIAQALSDTAVAETRTAQAVTERTISFESLGGAPVTTYRPLTGFEYEGDGLIMCFFAATAGPYPLPGQDFPTATTAPPAEAPALTSEPVQQVAPTDALTGAPTPEPPTPEPPLEPTATLSAEATPTITAVPEQGGAELTLLSVRLAQPGPPCLPQFATALSGLAALLGPDTTTLNYQPVVYPSLEGISTPVLTTDTGTPNNFINSAVAVLVFPRPVARARIDFWHPPNSVSGYRIYALDVTGAVIDSDETDNLGLASFQQLGVEQGTAGQQIAGVVLIGLDTSQVGNLRDDVLRAQQAVFLQSVTIPLN